MLRQPVCRERVGFNEVKTQSHSRKTRRGRITKLASVLGNPHSECAENASISMRSKRKSPSQCESRKKARITRQATVHGNPHMQHVREPHRYLPRYSGRISRARTRQKQPNLGTPTAGPEFDPGLRQPACRERINFNEVKTQIQSRKTRRGRITKLATVLGNPHSECAENASILMRSKRKSPSQCESRKKLGSRGRPPCTGTLTCSMFGNLTGTYPGVQAAFCEPGGTANPRPS